MNMESTKGMKTEKLAVILLAAGDSKRFQGNKMLALVNGKPMYEHLLETLEKIPADEKILVTQYPEIEERVKDRYEEFQVIKNSHSDWGISYSIKLGIKNSKADAYLFAVCDQPWLTGKSIEKLIGEFFKSKKRIACLSWQGRTGNPVIFDSCYREELLKLSGDTGGRKIIKSSMEDVEFVEAENQLELLDIDTREVYNQKKY